MKRILFVDEDKNSLDELRQILRGRVNIWDMTFIDDPREAVRIMDGEGIVDLVVASVDLQAMDSIDFLVEVRKNRPQIIRFALSDAKGRQKLLAASNLAHQFLQKPYEHHEVLAAISRALLLRDRLRQCPLREQLIEMGALPALPNLYGEVLAELNSSEASIAAVAEIVAKDVAMSAKVLQVVNSAAFGLRNPVSNITQAASLLGLEKISTLVLMVEVFAMASEEALPRGFSIDALWAHSLRVGEYAKKIAASAIEEAEVIDASFTAGLLHDIGMIVLASSLPTMLREALKKANEDDITLYDAEKAILGASHSEIGGYLLDLWGLPDIIVEGIAFHDYPSGLPEEDYATEGTQHDFRPLTAVHVANSFCEDERRAAYGCAESGIDNVYLERVAALHRVDDWWTLCHEDED